MNKQRYLGLEENIQTFKVFFSFKLKKNINYNVFNIFIYTAGNDELVSLTFKTLITATFIAKYMLLKYSHVY